MATAGARAARAVDAALMHAVDQGQWAGVLNALWLIAGKTPIESSLRSRCSCVPRKSFEGYAMNLSNDFAPHLLALQKRLDAVDGVRAAFASDSQVIAKFKGRRIGQWVPDGLF